MLADTVIRRFCYNVCVFGMLSTPSGTVSNVRPRVETPRCFSVGLDPLSWNLHPSDDDDDDNDSDVGWIWFDDGS